MTTFTGNKRKVKQKGHLNCSIAQPVKTDLSLCSLPLGDVSQGGTSATQRQKLHTDDIKSVQNLVISTDWMMECSHSFSKDLQWNNQSQLMEHGVPQFQGFAFVMNRATVPCNEPWMYICTTVLSNYKGRQVPGHKMLQHCLIHYGNIRSVWLDSINTSIHVSLYAPCVSTRLLYAIVHWLSFRHMSSYEVYFSLEEAFEFRWSLFADEHNTWLKSTRGNVKLNKFAFGTQDKDYRIYYVNIDLHHQYGISVAESQRSLLAKCQKRARSKKKQLFSQATCNSPPTNFIPTNLKS